MYSANFEVNNPNINIDLELSQNTVAAELLLNVTPDKLSQLINDVGYITTSALIPLQADILDLQTNKVDKVEGKGLSTNDFTDADKDKLDGIEAGAQVNTVYSVNGQTGDVFIELGSLKWGDITGTLADQTDLQNALDDKVDKETGKGLSTNDFTNAYKSKLEGIEAGAEVNTVTSVNGQVGDVVIDIPDSATWGNITGTLSNQTDLQNALDNKQAQLSQTQLNAVNSGATTTNIGQISTNTADISDINSLIPTQATTSNQLADKNFVNSSIATNTANFIGTFNSVAELEAYSGTLTNNDYAFVKSTDSVGNTLYDRYKYNADNQEWLFEYELNNSSFTAQQWASINSGITSGDVSLIGTALQPNDNITQLVNNAGYITGITSSDVTTALGYTPYNSSNPSGYISGITSGDVTTALGYTPYNSSNPNGYTSNVGTVTSVNNTSPDSNGDVTIAIPTVNNATLTVTQNGISAGTFTANASSDVTINVTDTTYSDFTGASSLADGAAGLVKKPVTGDQTKYLKGDGSWSTVAYSDVSGTPSLATVATSGSYNDLLNKPTIPTSADYWTVGTSGVSDYQTTYSKKMIYYKQSNAQDNGFRMLADTDTSPVATTGAWSARCLIGNEKRTFLLGTARNSASTSQSICGIGAHSWGSASSQTSAAWDNIYIQPDGSTATYIGGNGWRGNSGWFRVTNNNSGSAAYRAEINTGSNLSTAWKKILPNNATGSNSVLFTPTVSTTHTYTYATSVNSTVTANYGTSYGYGSTAANSATALGYNAKATGSTAIQIGQGTNSTANTMYVGLSSSLNVQLLNSSGKIPDDRINTTIARTSDVPTDTSDLTNNAGFVTATYDSTEEMLVL